MRRARCEDAQREGARFQRIADDDGHGRQAHDLLPDIILRAPVHVGEEHRPGIVVQLAAMHGAPLRQPERGGTEGGADEHAIEVFGDARTLGRLAAPPGRDIGQMQALAQQPRRELRQEGAERRRLQHARARRVRQHDIARGIGVDEPGDADLRMRIERQRIEHARIDPAPQRVDALEARDGADVELVFQRGEVGALDQQQAEIAREMRLFGIAGVVPPRRQQADAWVGRRHMAAMPARKAAKKGACRCTLSRACSPPSVRLTASRFSSA